MKPLRVLLAHRGYWRWSLTRQLARLPVFMASLAFVLVSTYSTGSPTPGGLMVTAFILGQTFLAPVAARLIDRLGAATGAKASLGLSAAMLLGLATAVSLKAPVSVLVLLAGLAGLLMAGQSSATRAMLSETVPTTLVGQALAIDTVLLEVLVVTAPLLAAGAAAVSPPFAVFVMAACHAAAALLIRTKHRQQTSSIPGETLTPAVKTRASNSLWRNPRFIFWLVASTAFGHAIGTAETAVVPLVIHLGGSTGEGATLLAMEAGASALAGLTYATLSNRLSAGALSRASVMLAMMAVSCIGLALAPNLVSVGVLLAVLGSCIAPFDVVRSQAAENEAPHDRKSEAFSLIGATHALGFSLAGLALAILPLRVMLIAGGISGCLALTLAPILMRQGRVRFTVGECVRCHAEVSPPD